MAGELKLQKDVSYVCVEGVIGVGKTSLCGLLAERFAARAVYECVEENPFLQKFYKNRKSQAFQTQLWFLLSRYRQVSEEFVQQDLFHGSTISDYLFAKDRIFATFNLDENEMALYDTVAHILERQIPRPDLVIYLQASTETLLKRIEMRGRPYESGMDPEYIGGLNEAYNHFFFHYNDTPLLIVNTNNIDFVNNVLDLDEVIEQIVRTRSGVNYYQPMGTNDRQKVDEWSRRRRAPEDDSHKEAL